MVAAYRRRRKNMSQLITRNEIEDLCEGELQLKFYAIMNDLIRTQRWQAERTMALAALETVEAELNRKRAQRSRFPSPRC
jgi:hypothetical protein